MASRAAPAGSAAATAPDPAHDVAQLPVANPGILIVGIMAASLLQVLDTTIANVAIPHMRTALGATTETITWVLTSYIIASAVALPITGWLADRVGGRRLFILSVAGFIMSSMLCGMAQNLEEMVLFRALQGVTGAFIAPLSQAFMLDTNKPSKHAQMMALWGMGIMIGPILGPVLGGWLTEQANWRWVFYVNLPVGILALALLITQLPHREGKRRKFDLFGFVMLAIALSSLQLLLDRGSQLDWFQSYEIWFYTFLMGSAAWIAIVHFTTAREPLFDKAIFADRNFVIALLFMVVIGMVLFANMALLPPMLQRLFGYGVIDTGMVLMPRGVGVMLSMQLSGVLIRRGLDARIVVATGFALGKALNKISVRAGVCDGFIGNRILATYRTAADHMVLDGASPFQIDKALVDFGFAMGPFAVGDLAGLDIGWATRKRKAATRHPAERVPTYPDKICEAGNFGQKTGKGYYIYEAGSRGGVPNPEVSELIAAERAERGITPRDFTDAEIVRRYMAAMVNEAAKVVGEGIAKRPLDVDMVLLFGYGFPRYWGGPMKWADLQGLPALLADIESYAKEDAWFWEPAPLLKQLVAEGRSFDDLNKQAAK